MTYLEIVRRVLAKVDTRSPQQVSSLSARDDYIHTFAEFAREAWVEIQLMHDAWAWRLREFDMATEAGQATYAWSDMSVPGTGDRSIPDSTGFRRWLGATDSETTRDEWFLLDPEIGVGAVGGRFPYVPYRTLRRHRITQRLGRGRPTQWSVDWEQRIEMYPVPDRRYDVSGMFVKGVQHLRSENDVPEGIDEEYHMAIVYGAVIKGQEFDEGYHEAQMAKPHYARLIDTMQRKYLPRVVLAPALE